MLPAEPQARTRPAPLATFEAALSLLESDPRFERAAESERCVYGAVTKYGNQF